MSNDQHEIRVTDAIINVLEEAGVRYVVGIPGGHVGRIYSSLYEHPTIRTLLVREESIGTAMAEAYGRLNGAPMAVLAQGEWVVGNAGQGLIEARLGASPVVVLTDMTDSGPLSHHGPYQDGSANYGSWDTRQALDAVCKRVFVSDYPEQAVQHTQLALKHALTGEQGPVAVVFRRDALNGRIDRSRLPQLYPTAPYLPRPSVAIDATALEQAAAALQSAVRPVVIAGNGVRLAAAQTRLQEFATTIDAPIVTTQSGKGVADETATTNGGVIGAFGWSSANALVAEADCIVAVGTKLSPVDTGDEHLGLIDPTRQTIVQIDIEPLNAGWTFPVDHVVIGDAGAALEQLSALVGSAQRGPDSAANRVANAVANDPFRLPRDTESTDAIEPQDAIALLRAHLPDDAIVTGDAGENRLFMMQWFETGPGGDYLQPGAGGGMGYAVPAALAAKLSHPERAVVAVCGDGGFGMSLHALMTAVQEDLPIAVVVLNNRALGWVANGLGKRAIASHFADFDHAGIARAIGCDGVLIGKDASLEEAFAQLSTLRRPLVIDVPVAMSLTFKDLMSDFSALERRVGGY